MKKLATIACVFTASLSALEHEAKSGSGLFVSFKNGALTLKGRSGSIIYQQVGTNYKTFENNEDGPGSRLVVTFDALSRVVPGTVFQVNVQDREIQFGLDHRVTGTFESYQDGKLNLTAAEVPPGFVQKPAGKVALTVNPGTPVLQSINSGDYRHAGSAGVVLKNVKPGTLLTARSEYDPENIEVIQIGEPKRRIERYIGQSRGPVRGTFVSFKDGILRIHGKGVTPLAANEYDRLISLRIADHIPIVESIDGDAYKSAGAGALKVAREGEIVTVRKIEEVILEVQIGVATK